jgi:glycosyltransferase involved in cell wall biosynthesis
MRVLSLSRYDRLGASSRVRTYQYIPALQAMGIDVEVAPLLRNRYLQRFYASQSRDWFAVFAYYLQRVLRLVSGGKYDLLWIEKELFPGLPAWFEQALAVFGVPYVVDYDDASFHNYDLSTNPIKKLLARKIDEVMRRGVLVLCGNNYLAERARVAGARRIEILPTVIDLNAYRPAAAVAEDRVVVCWIGTPYTVRYLELVMPALRLLSKEYPVQLRVIGAKVPAGDLDIECRSWSEETEVSELQKCTIGIMPLYDSPWERGKCGYKLIQYMACGLPVIASPVGANCDIIKNGVNGHLANTTEDWLSALCHLCTNMEARQKMGAAGRRLVEEKYCLQITAPQLARLFQEVAGKATP